MLAAAMVAAVNAAAEVFQADGLAELDWTAVGVSVGTAAAMAGLAYLERAFVDPRRETNT